MKSIRLLIALMLLPCLAFAGQGMGPGPGFKTYGGSLTTDSVDFSVMANANPVGGDFTTISGIASGMQVLSNQLRCITGATCGVYHNGMTSINAKQYSAVKVPSNEFENYIGGAVRIQPDATSMYVGVLRNTTTLKIVKVTAGTINELKSCTVPTLTSSSLVAIKANGSTLQMSVDGSDVTDCNITDSTFSSGYVGVASIGFDSRYTYWEGGEW